MAKTEGEHLSQEEIDLMVLTGSQETETDDSVRDRRAHLASCKLCRATLQANESQRQMLRATKSDPGAIRSLACPAEDEWQRFAAGLVADAEAGKLVAHAVVCDHCCLLLRQFSEDFSDALTPLEERAIEELSSSRPDWQSQMANKLAKASRREPSQNDWLQPLQWWHRQKWGIPRWSYVAAAIIMCAIFFGTPWYDRVRNSPDRLLAEAYSARRPFELRFTGANYGPLTQERRGGDKSRVNRPSALLEAEALIARKLAHEPDSTIWLQAQARADLLEGRYESATSSLQRALRTKPNSPSLLTDLASAHFLRAQAMDQALEYRAAIELLDQALAISPDDTIALFNRAIAYERMSLLPQAIADWKHYLRNDNTSGWAAEARAHLAALEH